MVTSLYAAILGIVLIILSIKTIQARRKFGVAIGDSNNLQMKRFMRAQANFTEYTPTYLILLGYAELNGLPIWAINFFGILFLMGRIIHAYSLLKHEAYDPAGKLLLYPKWRIIAMTCTFIAIGLLSITILFQVAIMLTNNIQ
ncbi:MAPEG family protein [Legionella hackeliae]|uniref:Putative glutathione S-transferase n=1 Tax=Legionella hackeliae TaxID=449 RepID=A0A0A8UXP3_LEGHA|nr:MAPEG family protein [Legionella hackeliae]KTD13174.1 glutathione S-transferase [Legionella hackeliae]CEK11514.1 putative glutathione S-transferase [Legionella hackeliae]STX48283.1 glutathione S-transferase [Legionella hackeliae]